jgi:hypothetical protein
MLPKVCAYQPWGETELHAAFAKLGSARHLLQHHEAWLDPPVSHDSHDQLLQSSTSQIVPHFCDRLRESILNTYCSGRRWSCVYGVRHLSCHGIISRYTTGPVCSVLHRDHMTNTNVLKGTSRQPLVRAMQALIPAGSISTDQKPCE